MEEYLKSNDGHFKYKDFDSRYFCPLCLIKKPSKTRHVKRINVCVRNYHFYSKWFDKLVTDSNYRIYMLVLLMNLLFLGLTLKGTFAHYEATTGQSWWMYIADFINEDFIWWQKLVSAFNLLMLWGLIVDLYVQLVAASYNLTYDELFRPQYYPYLYHKAPGHLPEYKNPNGKGLLNNWKLFLRRMIRI